MHAKPLQNPLPLIISEADYQSALARFWDLVGTETDLSLLVALRESLRDYEHRHPKAGSAFLKKPGSR